MNIYDNLTHTFPLRIVLDANKGTTLNACIREGIVLSAQTGANVVIHFNDSEYSIFFNDLMASVK